MTFIQTLIISIITAITTGALSIFGVVLTLRQNNKQLKAQFDERMEEKKQAIIDNRPEFEIVERKCYFEPHCYSRDNSVDIDCMVTIYDKSYTKEDFENNLVMVEYVLKNIGKSRVETIELCYYDHEVELLDMSNADIDEFIANPNRYATTTFVSYSGLKVHHNEEVKMRIWFRKNNVYQKLISYPSFLGIRTFDKRRWIQNFNPPYEMLEESSLFSNAEYIKLLYRKQEEKWANE